MTQDTTHAITEAEQKIHARHKQRRGTRAEFRQLEALELIADQLTCLHAEVRMLRRLFATYAARAEGRQ